MTRRIIIEGLDGAGKDTALDGLQEYLEETGRTVLRTKTPSFNPVGDLLSKHYFGKAREMFPDNERCAMFMGALFAADMLEHDREVRQFIKDDGDRSWVLQSRTWISTWSYQAPSPTVQEMLEDGVAPLLLPPDLLVFMYADVDTCMERIGGREKAVVDMYEHRSNLEMVLAQMKGFFEDMVDRGGGSPWAGVKVLQIDTTNLSVAKTFTKIWDFLYQEHLLDADS